MAASFFPMPPAARARSIVYVDGFNFYYGALKGGPNKWLNLERLFVSLRQDDDVRRVHYFTARVSPPESVRQDAYLRALQTLPLVNIIEGKFKDREVHCRVRACTYPGSKVLQAPTEKRTDVNIALQLLDDAYQDLCDRFIIVSGDSDLVPALEMVKGRFPKKKIVVYIPSRDPVRGAATELRGAADTDRTFPLALLSKCQFPATVPDGKGGTIAKPPGW